MNELCIENNTNGYYVYLVNAALVIVSLYGNYFVGDTNIEFNSGNLLIGQTVTVNIPANAKLLDIRVDAVYLFWVNIYRNYMINVTKNTCLLTTGVVFATRCDEIPCRTSMNNMDTCKNPVNSLCNNQCSCMANSYCNEKYLPVITYGTVGDNIPKHPGMGCRNVFNTKCSSDYISNNDYYRYKYGPLRDEYINMKNSY